MCAREKREIEDRSGHGEQSGEKQKLCNEIVFRTNRLALVALYGENFFDGV